MRKSFKKWLILLLAVIASTLVFAGCQLGLTLQDYLDDYGLTASVTYYANEGKFNNNQKTKTIYMPKDSKALEIGVVQVEVGSVITISYGDDYEFGGWYFAERDNDGNVVYTDETKQAVVLSNQAVDFNQSLAENENWVIGAKWLKLEVVDVFLVYDDAAGIQVGETTVKNGEPLREYSFNGGMVVTEPTLAPVDTDTDCTFVEFYQDQTCTTPVAWPIQRTGTGENVKIYAKYLKGNWKILDSSSDLFNFFAPVVSGNYYLLNDIDANGAQYSPITTFSGRLEGNGHIISNVKIASTIRSNGMNRVAVFGDITSTAIMKDVTFKDFNVVYTMQTGKLAELYFFNKSLASGATFENVLIDGGTLTVNLAANDTVNNMNIVSSAAEGGYLKSNYLFGSYDADLEGNTYATDEQFLAAVSGISFVEESGVAKKPTLSVPKLDPVNN